MNNWFNVPTTQTPIFVLFLSAGVLCDGTFSLWVSLTHKSESRFETSLAIKNCDECNQMLLNISEKLIELTTQCFLIRFQDVCDFVDLLMNRDDVTLPKIMKKFKYIVSIDIVLPNLAKRSLFSLKIHHPKSGFICVNESPLKWWKMLFISS